MTQGLLLCLLTLVASGIGTATGFGTSTIMIPVLTLFMPMPIALLFVGIIHLCGDIWFLGASLSLQAPDLPFKRMLGAFLILYVIFLFLKRDWALPKTQATAVCGGLLSGLFAGFFGVGGAVRGAFLTTFNLPKEVYIFTSGLIALFIDVTRVSRYVWGGTRMEADLLYPLIVCIPISFAGAYLAKRFLNRLPQKSFRMFVGFFLALVGIMLLVQS